MTKKDEASGFYRALKTRAARKIRAAMGFDDSYSGDDFQNVHKEVEEKWSTA